MSTPWRDIIVGHLEGLASEEAQREYEKNVPHVDITKELLCGWFDDSYQPDDAYFVSCFTDMELKAMAAFNAYFEERTTRLPMSNGTVETWLASSEWREVMTAAAKTLDAFEVSRNREVK